MTAACAFDGLTKLYGDQVGVDELTFRVEPGEVFGFLGANGAGKTTAMRVLVGLLHPTRGRVELFGDDATAHGATLRAEVGYLPGTLALYGDLTARAHLEFLAHMRERDCTDATRSLATRLDLDLGRRVRDLSKGNQQKVGLIAAFMHAPRLLVLDEPTSGLDPLVQREFEAMLDEACARGAAALLSSHVLSEVEHQADRVGVLHHGHLVQVSPMPELRARARRTLEFDFEAPPDVAALRAVPGVLEVRAHGAVATCIVRGDEHEVLREAVRQGVRAVRSHEQSLEDVFFEIIDGGVGHDDGAHPQDAA